MNTTSKLEFLAGCINIYVCKFTKLKCSNFRHSKRQEKAPDKDQSYHSLVL